MTYGSLIYPGRIVRSNHKKRKRPRELVHGLEILTPLKDYDFAYLLAALRTYREKCVEEGNRHGIWWSDHLTKKLRKYFSPLIRETKRENHRLRETEAQFKSLTEFATDPD